jgi:hypothetical protein
MKFQAIQKMGKEMGLPVYRRKKTDLIRDIQNAEGNMACFGTDRVAECGEDGCLWRQDCESVNATAAA